MKTTGKIIIFLGDSITEGVGASKTENRWTDLVGAEGEFAQAHNFGVSGTRIAPQVSEQSDGWSESYVARVDRMPDVADYILVFGGTNDYGHGDAALGRLGDRTPDTFYGATDTLLVKLKAKYPKAKIGVLTPIHRANENRVYNEFGVRNCACLADYVKAEKEVCLLHQIPVLDLYETSGIYPDEEANRKAYAPDGLHPNDAGYRILADQILAFLQTL